MLNPSTACRKLKRATPKICRSILLCGKNITRNLYFENNPKYLKNEIPVFTFHSVEQID